MKERPIIFSAPMVRAIVAGTKTQTRRIVKPQPEVRVAGGAFPSLSFNKRTGDGFWLWPNAKDSVLAECPYGITGDRLWVRETCRAEELDNGRDGVRYLADDAFVPIQNTKEAGNDWCDLHAYRGKRGATVPPIHMPRWASRITLEITDVRVQRLHDISEADAIAEGVKVCPKSGTSPGYVFEGTPYDESGLCHSSATMAFSIFWDTLNSKRTPWDSNPFVWAITFRRVQP